MPGTIGHYPDHSAGVEMVRLQNIIDSQRAEIERLRNIALDSLPYLQRYAAGMRGGPDRAKLRAVIGQIVAFVPDGEQKASKP